MGIDELRRVVERMHDCSASHSGSAPVEEVFQGQTVWKGRVEIFDLTGHPKASRAYAWEHETSSGTIRRQAVLELPPVESPETAVRAVVVSEFRQHGSKES